MTCQEFEISILNYQEHQLSPAEQKEVENHIANCAGCRTFARQLQKLDAALVAEVRVPALSAGFDQRLRARIHVAPAALSEAQRAERKRQLQAEFQTGMARIGRSSFALGSLLDHLGWPILAVIVASFAWLLTSQLTAHLSAQSLDGLAPNLLSWLVASAVFLVVAFPRQWNFIRVW